MNWKNIRLIFLREIRDQLRDRRTLFMVAVLPLLLYPALGIGMVQMQVTFSERTRIVAVIGVDDLPTQPLIEGDHFLKELFNNPDDADKIRVVTEQLLVQPGDESPEVLAFLKEAHDQRDQIANLGRNGRRQQRAFDAKDKPLLLQLEAEEAKQKADLDKWFTQGPVQVLIVVPHGFGKRLDEINRLLAGDRPNPPPDPADGTAPPNLEPVDPPVILKNGADERSSIAYRRVKEVLAAWEQLLLAERLRFAHLPESINHPLDAAVQELAANDALAANLWSKLFPALLVIMSVTGAFYPAIDLGAGEKERGTMETLLICPASRTEIVIGKFLTILCFSLTTALLNIASMGFTGRHILSVTAGGQLKQLGDLSFPPATALMWVVLLAIPLAGLFSALSLAFATFARSTKEGQYYLTPLLMVTMGLTMFCLHQEVEINPYYSIMPVMGPALLLKALLMPVSGGTHLAAYATPVLLSSIFYSGLALWWAINQFCSEDILFREAERFDIGLWMRHIFRDKEDTPSPTEAGFCFVLIGLMQFVALSTMQAATVRAMSGSPLESHVQFLQLEMIYLLATVGGPAVLMAIMLTKSVRKTLKLYFPRPSMILAAIVLPLALRPVSSELLQHLDWFFPKIRGMKQVAEALGDMQLPGWISFVAIAVCPAVCEEVAFRGFILSGLQRSRSFWFPILMSAFGFGVIHLISQQVFNAFLMGIVLGLLAVRSRSLLPPILFHLINNGVEVIALRSDLRPLGTGIGSWLFRIEVDSDHPAMQQLRFTLLAVVIGGSIAAAVIYWLIQYRTLTRPTDERRWPLRELPETTVGISNTTERRP